jgi:hypothetical protein
MSCYILPSDHLSYLVDLGARLGVEGIVYAGSYRPICHQDPVDVVFIFDELAATNWASAGHAPADSFVREFPDRPIDHLALVDLIDIVQALQWVRCYRYQSCETTNWTTTFAYHYTRRLQSELISRIIAHFETQWDFPCPRLTKAA